MVKHSRVVNFIVKLRPAFLDEFSKHKQSFPGCDGESLFIGTVLHSLEHLFFERIFEDPLWVDVDCPR